MSGRRGRRPGNTNTTPSKSSEPATPTRSSRRLAATAASSDTGGHSSPALPAVPESSPHPSAANNESSANSDAEMRENLMSNNSPAPSSPLLYQTSPGGPGATSEIGGMADDENDEPSSAAGWYICCHWLKVITWHMIFWNFSTFLFMKYNACCLVKHWFEVTVRKCFLK